MNLPNYKNQSIVNLMASLAQVLGGNSQYEPLKGLSLADSADKNIILIVLDGLGYDFLQKYGKNSFLHQNLKGKMTSVFPSTTASAITSFATGLAPQQHGLTGWFVYLEEIKKIIAVLPLIVRGEKKVMQIDRKKAAEIYNYRSFSESVNVPAYTITHKDYINSAYNKSIGKDSRGVPYKTLAGFFKQIRETSSCNSKRKYIYAYWGGLDSACHKHGVESTEATKHFRELDKRIRLLIKYLKNKNATVIITADHGLINTKEENKIIRLENHPELQRCLDLPLSGDPRAAYCYVKKSKTKQFESYIKKELSKACWLYKSSNLIKKNYFGLHKPNKNLSKRVGNYTLIMKDNYIIKDFVKGEEQKIFIGNHGGVSREEMFVPLIVC